LPPREGRYFLSIMMSATAPIASAPKASGDEYQGVATGKTGAADGLSPAAAPAPNALRIVAYHGVDELLAAGDDVGTFQALAVDGGVSPAPDEIDDATLVLDEFEK
jgi:hypothetical protein